MPWPAVEMAGFASPVPSTPVVEIAGFANSLSIDPKLPGDPSAGPASRPGSDAGK